MTIPLGERVGERVSDIGADSRSKDTHALFGMDLPGPVLVAAVALVMLTGTLVSTGGESAVGVGARLTARLTFVFFIAAYLARPVWQRFRWQPARWALRNRRWLGLAAALSHSVHLSYVVAAQMAANEPLDLVTLVGGGLGFVLFWVLGVTSSDTATRLLGRGWKWLHRIGIHYLWFIFFITYAGAATSSPWLWVFVAALVFGAGLRAFNTLRPIS